jgi:hypothetical protein
MCICIFSETQPILEPEMMKRPGVGGISVSVNHLRPPCLTTAIPINPNDPDFAKLCIAAQLFSMAQKWVWTCLDEEDVPQPVLRMPCSYSNIMTLNLESMDVIGSFEAMRLIVQVRRLEIQALLLNITLDSKEFHVEKTKIREKKGRLNACKRILLHFKHAFPYLYDFWIYFLRNCDQIVILRLIFHVFFTIK